MGVEQVSHLANTKYHLELKKKKDHRVSKQQGHQQFPPGKAAFHFLFKKKNPFFVCASANRNARRNEKKGCPFPFSKFPNPYNHSKPPPIITSSTITRKRPLAITFSPCSSWGPWSWRYRGTSWNGSFVACLLSRISISLGPAQSWLSVVLLLKSRDKHTLLSGGLLDLGSGTDADETVVRLELLQGLSGVVDQGEAGALATTVLRAEAEDGDLVLVGLVETGELVAELILGDVGTVGVEDVTRGIIS